MQFKLIENYNTTRNFVQEYIYDAIEELGNASLEEYIQWFMSDLIYFDDEVRQAVKDSYIEAIDCGKIDLPKTMITSELTTYLESNADLIDTDIDALIENCPAHLKHELNIVLSKLDESLTEELLTEEQVIYKITHEGSNTHVFLNVTENKDLQKTDEDAQTKLAAILENPTSKYGGEVVNQKIAPWLSSVYKTDPHSIKLTREGMFSDVKEKLNSENMLMLTLSTWRKQAHNNSTIKHIVNKLNIGNDYLIHHKDGKEWNNDDIKNLLIVPSGNATDEKDLRNFIHYSLHMIAKSGKGDGSQKSKSFPLYYVNDENEVCRTYLTLQLHTNRKLFELS